MDNNDKRRKYKRLNNYDYERKFELNGNTERLSDRNKIVLDRLRRC